MAIFKRPSQESASHARADRRVPAGTDRSPDVLDRLRRRLREAVEPGSRRHVADLRFYALLADAER